MKVAVVVIGRNEAKGLAQALDSALLAVRELRGEVIYVDSGSSDGSLEIARERREVRTLVLDGAPCAARARNLGIRSTCASFVQLLDGDMELDAEWLAGAIEVMEGSGSAAVSGFLNERNLDATPWNTAFGCDWTRKVGAVEVLGGAALWRRAVLSELGGFCEDMRVGEDPDLALRARAAGYELEMLDKPMATHDLDLESFADWWRRALAVGESRARVAQRHPYRGDARAACRAPLIFSALVALVLVAVALLGKPVLALASGAAVLLVTRRAVLDLRAGLDSRAAWLHALHVYGVKLPVALGATCALLQVGNRRAA